MKYCKGFAALLLLSVLFVPMVHAQLNLSVDSVITTDFPNIKVNVETRFSGVISREFDSTNFRLIEDGFVQQPLHFSCPPPTEIFSLTIIIAVGSSMSAGDIGFAKGVASRVVSRLNGIVDEASVIMYDGNQFIQQEFTHIIPLLTQRIDAIAPTGGDNHMWDGVYAGVSYCANDGVHLSRGVLLLSNGKGDGGTKNLNDVITLAKAAKLPVYCLGINAVNSDQDMKSLSAQTGGKYYNNADQTVQELIDELSGTPPYCTLEYTTNNLCRDGADRALSVRLRKDNDSTDLAHTFELTTDASTNVSVTLKVDTGTVTTGLSSELALQLLPAIQGQRLHDGYFDMQFDTSALKLQAVRTTGYLADGMTATPAMTANGARITLSGLARLDGSGTLMMLDFIGGSVLSATSVSVGLSDVQLSGGCLNASLPSTNVMVVPKRASISTKASPVIFTWDASGKRYSPDPGVISVEVTNNGDLAVTNLTATLEETPEIRMAYGTARTVTVQPSDLGPGAKGTAVWYVQALPQQSETTAQVNANVQSDEGANATQRLFLNIKAAESAYRMDCDVDVITIASGSYTPDPAEVRATVTSAGTMDSPAGEVTIVLPPELTLSGGSAAQQFASMVPGNTQVLTWPVTYPTPAVKTDYPVLFISSSAGYPSDTCRTMLTVPVLTSEQLAQRCGFYPAVIDSTVGFDPMTVGSWVRNDGNVDAYGVTAEIRLQSGLFLAAGQDASTIIADTLAAGDSVQVTWQVRPAAHDACDDEQFTADIVISSNETSEFMCTAVASVHYRDNLLPEITQVSPAVLDTTDKDTEVTFSVTAYDKERATIVYIWYVDDAAEATGSDSFDWTFDTLGEVEVKVEIYDPCSLAADVAVTYTWNVVVRDPTGIADNPAALREFAILGNYPNPFNPATTIEYRLPQGQHDVRLDVYDAYGRHIRSLVSGEQSGGTYRKSFDAASVPSGTYIARLTVGGVVRMHRMVLVK